MNKFLITFLVSFSSIIYLNAQDTIALWPFQGKHSGEGILYKPQDYIYEEKNAESLFITAPEGTLIVAPKDGIITHFSYGYKKSLFSSVAFKDTIYSKVDIAEYDTQQRLYFTKTTKDVQFQFISLTICISCGTGEKIYIEGIRPVKFFRTGEKVKKGDIIGKVGFCYKKIPKPCIQLTRSSFGMQADPMSQFGLKTTFVPFKVKHVNQEKIPVKELIEDFNIFRGALEESYPGLYDYTSKENINQTFESAFQKLKVPITSGEFIDIINPVVDSLRDSHLRLSYNSIDKSTRELVSLPVRFGVQNDSLIIFQTLPQYKGLLGKNIIEINGKKTTDILKEFHFSGRNDGYISGNNDFIRFRRFVFYFVLSQKPFVNKGDSLVLKFSDGEKVTLNYIPLKEQMGLIPVSPKRMEITKNYETKKITSKTAWLNIRTFDLTKFDIDSIGYFIKEISKKADNLIIDVRGNYGGAGTYVDIFSMLANKPFKSSVTSMVRNNGKYNFIKDCTNYGDTSFALFPDFVKIEGKEGFYLLNNDSVKPNDSIHFGGNLYVLTDQNSFSASTIFAALVHKYKRGVIIGRETGSGYYQMNAEKFATVNLKNSGLELNMPLVKCIFDDKMDRNIPWGRGVIPDYPIGFSYKELFSENDLIFEYTLKLIDDISKTQVN